MEGEEHQQSSTTSSDGSGGGGVPGGGLPSTGRSAGSGPGGYNGPTDNLRMSEERLRTLEMSFGFLTSQNLMIQTQVGNLSLVFLDVHSKVINLTSRLEDLERWKDEFNGRLNAIEMIATTPTLLLQSPPLATSAYEGIGSTTTGGVNPAKKKRVRKSRASTNSKKSGNATKTGTTKVKESTVTNGLESNDTGIESIQNVPESKPIKTDDDLEGEKSIELSPSRSLTTVDSIISLVVSAPSINSNSYNQVPNNVGWMGSNNTVVLDTGNENVSNGIAGKKRRVGASRASNKTTSFQVARDIGTEKYYNDTTGPSKSKRYKSTTIEQTNVIFKYPEPNAASQLTPVYRCELCCSNFWSKEDLLEHEQLHNALMYANHIGQSESFDTKKKPLLHACNICTREFKTKYHLQSHQTVHNKKITAGAGTGNKHDVVGPVPIKKE